MAKKVVVSLAVRDENAGRLLDVIRDSVAYGDLGDTFILKSEVKNLSSNDLATMNTEQKEAVNVPTNIE